MKTTNALFLLLALCYASAAQADTFGSGTNQFEIEFVTVGDPDNPADTTGDPNPAGSVPHEYRIGKYEISRDMITKGNEEAGLGISLIDMSSRGGNEPDKPATGVTWIEAAKFVNWLNTESGGAAAYKFDANENFRLWEHGDEGYDPNNLYRNSHATYFLPSMDEWYKAAYYDPIARIYYDYPTGSDIAPSAVDSGADSNTAVYKLSPFTGPAKIHLAGGLSPYGTMGQGGNVWEWQETEFDLVNDSTAGPRSDRGGGWIVRESTTLMSSVRGFDGINFFNVDLGFRVASITIPEPTTATLALAATLFFVGRRRP